MAAPRFPSARPSSATESSTGGRLLPRLTDHQVPIGGADIYTAVVDVSSARSALVSATDRVAELFSSLHDPGVRARGSDWTAAEVAAHLSIIGGSYAQYLGGDPTPVVTATNLNADNARTIAAVDERAVGVLVDRIRAGTDRFLELTEGMPTDTEVPWHGVTATVGSLYGVWLGELLVHGWDVARSAGRRWPIARGEAAMIVEGSAHIAPNFVDRERTAGLRATYELNLRRGPAMTFRFADGVLDVTSEDADDADARISANPRAVMFVLYKRKRQSGQIARGRMLAYGRRPWLAFGFANLFRGF